MDRENVAVTSYANIALIKYWGKADPTAMRPATSSISLTLEALTTDTEIAPLSKEATEDIFYLDGERQGQAETAKVSKVLDRFRRPEDGFCEVRSVNHMPTAAGLSSSSSGLSALVRAANQFYQCQWDTKRLAQEAKFASGSSARSLYGPVVAWDKDSGAIFPVKTNLKLAMIILVISDQKKAISSREGMKRCVETASNFSDWVTQSAKDYTAMQGYLAADDFEAVGRLTESNALAMHSTTRASQPPFSYLTSASQAAMDRVRALRASGERCYFTMDAGPNVKVLCLEEDLDRLSAIFAEDYQVIASKTKELS
ncbi:diphosphomevalonate decarboxylase [Streptococcus sp. DD12]|uniref:diphosphomevalonate decarboxylase n=1 Tax=Streptococcus sp. DD12 TaxID=1777880 RepID=UPI00079434C3|nr:diphosphomevalonate decarboxylase [Streptococcus sp. DD12]KXT75781.1 Diphosphomevalonate decarboxylase [Streptococcus sp. DD12]